jgi:hypothetical protein
LRTTAPGFIGAERAVRPVVFNPTQGAGPEA